MGKTKSYTKKAIDNYRNKHDFLNLTLDQGTRDRMKAVNLVNKDIVNMLMLELEKREKSAENSD